MEEKVPIFQLIEFNNDFKSICRTMILQKLHDFVDYCFTTHNLKPFKQVVEIMTYNSNTKLYLYNTDHN